MGKIKAFFESLMSKKGCANCLYHTLNKEGRVICSLSEKERKDCQSYSKDNDMYSNWKPLEKQWTK